MFFKGLFSKGKEEGEGGAASSNHEPAPAPKKGGFHLFRSVRKAFSDIRKPRGAPSSPAPPKVVIEGLEELDNATVVAEVRKGRTRGPQGRKRPISARPFSTASLDIELAASAVETVKTEEKRDPSPVAEAMSDTVKDSGTDQAGEVSETLASEKVDDPPEIPVDSGTEGAKAVSLSTAATDHCVAYDAAAGDEVTPLQPRPKPPAHVRATACERAAARAAEAAAPSDNIGEE